MDKSLLNHYVLFFYGLLNVTFASPLLCLASILGDLLEPRFEPGTEVAHIDFDIERSFFHTDAFLSALCAHLTGLNLNLPLDNKAAPFERFKRGTLPWFMERLGGAALDEEGA